MPASVTFGDQADDLNITRPNDLLRLQSVPIDDELDSSISVNDVQSSSIQSTSYQSVQVSEVNIVVRVRQQTEHKTAVHISQDGSQISILNRRVSADGKHHDSMENYNVTKAIKPKETQKDVFEAVGIGPAKDAMVGHASLIVAIGNTGTGKTHTLYGPEELFHKKEGFEDMDVGLVFRAIDYVFETLLARKHLQHFELHLSVCELYCEGKSVYVRDLLNIEHKMLSKYDNFLDDITVKKVSDRSQATRYIKEAFKCRKVSSTNLNQHSSRSFLFMSVKILQWMSQYEILEGELMFVDFAGWEQAKRTGAKGKVLQEATFINSQLLGWTKCLDALALGRGHIPYADCALTRLLRKYLEESVVTMILTVSPDYSNAMATNSFLRKIKNISKIITKSRTLSRRTTIQERMSVAPGRLSTVQTTQLDQLELENYSLQVKQKLQEHTMKELQDKLRVLTETFQNMPSPSREPGRGISVTPRSPSTLRYSTQYEPRCTLTLTARPGEKTAVRCSSSPSSEPIGAYSESSDHGECVPQVVQNLSHNLLQDKMVYIEEVISQLCTRIQSLEGSMNVQSRLEALEDKWSPSDRLSDVEQRLATIESRLQMATAEIHRNNSSFLCCTIM